jgi:leader peptidase (prepilin peptidase) / N-methyltransferase
VTVLVLVLVGLIGLVVGSFLNLMIDDLSRTDRLVSSEPQCPVCGVPTTRWYTVPVVTWLLRRGRCPACRAWMRPRDRLVEVATAVIFVVLFARLDGLGQLAAVPAFLYFAAASLALAFIDAKTHRLPDRLVLPSYPVLVALLAGAAGVRGDWESFTRALIGGVVLFALFFLVALAYPAGLGFGDVKFAGLVGGVLAYLSWSALVLGVFAGFVFAAVVGVGLIAAGRANRRTAIPFGPFLVLGALLGVFGAVPTG